MVDNTRYWLLLSLLGWLGLSACEEPVDLGIELSSSQLVVTSNFAPHESVKVRVAKTVSVLNADRKDELILDADVAIYEGEELIADLYLVDPRFGEPYYSAAGFLPQTNRAYTLEVAAPGLPPVSATSSIPEPIHINKYDIAALDKSYDWEAGQVDYTYEVQMDYEDPPLVRNYYHLNFYQQILEFEIVDGDTLVTDSSQLFPLEFSEANDDNFVYAAIIGGILLQDRPYPNGISFYLRHRLDPQRQKLGQLIVELRTVSDEYYRFYNSVSRQQNSGAGGGLSQPVIEFNNVQNGRGIFAGYNKALDSLNLSSFDF